ncbi:DUF3592 domain-containing protein [Variovorax ginsengisoli]|nr:DUF3592 domain-containing protein [Variovorax ginsengisoli]
MDDAVVSHALSIFKYALLAGLAVSALLIWRKGVLWGIGIGALMVGAAGFYGAASVGWPRYQALAHTERIQGRVVAYVSENGMDSKGNTTVWRAPVVEFRAADGQLRRIQGIGGSLPRSKEGDPAEVRVAVGNPADARVADFQDAWGLVIGLAIFSLFPTLIGLALTYAARRQQRSPALEQDLP